MTRVFEKLKNIFGGKEEQVEENPQRLGCTKKREEQEESEVGQRWKIAKKWRENKQMQESLIKRNNFKKKI
ncbi:MAG: hypothetical protein WC462_01720 [archaeon]